MFAYIYIALYYYCSYTKTRIITIIIVATGNIIVAIGTANIVVCTMIIKHYASDFIITIPITMISINSTVPLLPLLPHMSTKGRGG
jgi:hypothetical protein